MGNQICIPWNTSALAVEYKDANGVCQSCCGWDLTAAPSACSHCTNNGGNTPRYVTGVISGLQDGGCVVCFGTTGTTTNAASALNDYSLTFDNSGAPACTWDIIAPIPSIDRTTYTLPDCVTPFTTFFNEGLGGTIVVTANTVTVTLNGAFGDGTCNAIFSGSAELSVCGCVNGVTVNSVLTSSSGSTAYGGSILLTEGLPP